MRKRWALYWLRISLNMVTNTSHPQSEPVEEVDFGDNIDMGTFEQILEMDEPGDYEFSHSIVFGFFEQADETFGQIEEAL
jgi:osomolarity two-component system phosphorelay intermediate protein YPD1